MGGHNNFDIVRVHVYILKLKIWNSQDKSSHFNHSNGNHKHILLLLFSSLIMVLVVVYYYYLSLVLVNRWTARIRSGVLVVNNNKYSLRSTTTTTKTMNFLDRALLGCSWGRHCRYSPHWRLLRRLLTPPHSIIST